MLSEAGILGKGQNKVSAGVGVACRERRRWRKMTLCQPSLFLWNLDQGQPRDETDRASAQLTRSGK